jgi:hypothetical protein
MGANDLLIAAHALALGHTVVTDNEREFSSPDRKLVALIFIFFSWRCTARIARLPRVNQVRFNFSASYEAP